MNRSKGSLGKDLKVVCLTAMIVSGAALVASLIGQRDGAPEARTISFPTIKVAEQTGAHFFS